MTLPAFGTWDGVAGALVFGAEAYAVITLFLGYFQSLHPLERKPVPVRGDPESWPTVDVYIPTYNEPLPVVRATVLAAKAIDWPASKLRIYLLDDGRRPAFRTFAAEAGIGYIARPDNKGAKAGNLNHAMQHTDGEFIAIFDCDHVPTRSFLQMTMGWFQRDKKLGLVQTPHHFYSPDPFERNLDLFRRIPNEGNLFYGLIQPCNDTWNAAFFCGSCAVMRRTALRSIGGFSSASVTEDAHTALKMHRKGWSSAFLPVVQAAGLATESLSAHVSQRIRWARGMAQIFRIDNPLLGRGLRFAQRLSYASSMLRFFHGLPRLVFLIAPLFYLFFGLHVFNATPLLILAHWLPHMALALFTNSRLQGRVRHTFWSELYEASLAFYISIPTTMALIHPKAGSFNVTAKGGQIRRNYFDWRIAAPYLVLFGLNLLGVAVAIYRLRMGIGEPGVTGINLGWTVFNLLILSATVALAWERKQLRKTPRLDLTVPVVVRLASGHTIRTETRDLSMGGASLRLPLERNRDIGEEVSISFAHTPFDIPIQARVVTRDDDVLRVAFRFESLAEEEALVRAIFSRADAWLDWRLDPPKDRPVRALALFLAKGLAGLVAFLSFQSSGGDEEEEAPEGEIKGSVAGGARA